MIFLDSSYLISLIFNGHEDHEKAKKLYYELDNKEKIISKLVFTEVITVLDKKLKVSKELLEYAYNYLNTDFNIIDDYAFFDNAMEQVLKQKHLGFFDCMYITIMEKLEIEEIATLDEDFNNIKGIKPVK
ncbi:MAG: PIN domain-containing protein [Methanobrevibacter sp.]|jgi:predicted nucleic acid-binding protein|nr:PIN domain-containing protein [Candidatus Methanovirga aequatorialis]